MTFAPGKDAPIGIQSLTETSTVQKHRLGTIVKGQDASYGDGEFIYLKGVASTIVGSFVTYNMDDGSTALLVANAIGPVAIALSANVASQYGWYQISGKGVGAVQAAVADNADIYASSTAGKVDDTVVTGDRVQLAKAASASTGAGTIDVELHRPFVDNAVGAGST